MSYHAEYPAAGSIVRFHIRTLEDMRHFTCITFHNTDPDLRAWPVEYGYMVQLAGGQYSCYNQHQSLFWLTESTLSCNTILGQRQQHTLKIFICSWHSHQDSPSTFLKQGYMLCHANSTHFPHEPDLKLELQCVYVGGYKKYCGYQ